MASMDSVESKVKIFRGEGEAMQEPESGSLDKTLTVDHGLHPRQILPTEVWDVVFKHVRGTRDWLHCFYASSVFRTEPWLKWTEKRVFHLFPEVLRILNKQNTLEESDYLSCRLVCKSWKSTTDEFLQYSTLQFCFSSTPEKPWVDLWTAIEFFDNHADNFVSLVDYWLTSHPASTNPFPSRQLEFWDMHVSPPNRLKFKQATVSFLGKFGHHLWYFSYHACRDDMFSTPVDWYLTVRRWLELMPNLRKICLSYGGENHVLNNESLTELEDTVGLHPFPQFENLVTLETEYLPYSILNSAVSANRKIQRLEQHPNSYRLPWTNYGNIDLAQLTEFTTRLYTMYDVHQLQIVNWPLKILNLRCWNVNVEGNWNFAEIIQAIQHFQETLKSLKLEVTMLDPGVQLQMPLLEQLEIECDNDGRNFVQFVACLTALRKCSLSVDLSGSDNHVIPFESMESHIQSMKIHVAQLFVAPLWNMLPCLESVFVQTYVPPYRVQYDYTYKRNVL